MSPSRRSTGEPAARQALQARLLAALQAGRFASAAGFAEGYEAVCRYQARFGPSVVAAAAREQRALPAELFKYQRLATFEGRGRGYFLSSGTSRGQERRARHWFADSALYEAALTQGFAQAVFGCDGLDEAWSTVAPQWNLLVPASAAWWHDPHSSLAQMGRTIWRSLKQHGGGQLHRIDPGAPAAAFAAAVQRLQAASGRVTLGFGTGFGFLHLSDRLGRERRKLELHPASWLLETGGYKGKGRELAPAVLHRELAARFGLTAERVLTEYGMTELSSQAYALSGAMGRRGAPYPALPVYWPAATLRIRVVDAAGQACKPGQLGLIEATDVMNLTSSCRLLLGDVGVVVPEGRRGGGAGLFERRRFQVLGRAARLAARGCGLAADMGGS